MQNATLQSDSVTRGPWKVGTGGTTDHKLSSQWWNRPDDERFLNLDDLYAHVKRAADESFFDVIDVRDVRVLAEKDDPDDLRLLIPSKVGEVEAKPTHWSFGQMCSLLQVPSSYLRKLPAPIAGINMQYALATFREEAIKSYVRDNGRTELRAATGPDYGRIYDHECVDAVRRIAGNGVGDTHWTVPGVLDWSTRTYNPNAEVTKESTTLFASDRDVFLFLCDQQNPIEIGKLPDGSPDLLMRGFYVWNSEVGSKSIGVATMYFRAVCQNRILWGVEGYQEITLRHSKNAPMRFAGEVGPALESFAHQSTTRLLTGIKAARDAVVADSDEKATEWMLRQGYTKPQTAEVIATVLKEEGHAPRSVWDFVQGITAVARGIPHTDDRITMERSAGRLLEKVA